MVNKVIVRMNLRFCRVSYMNVTAVRADALIPAREVII